MRGQAAPLQCSRHAAWPHPYQQVCVRLLLLLLIMHDNYNRAAAAADGGGDGGDGVGGLISDATLCGVRLTTLLALESRLAVYIPSKMTHKADQPCVDAGAIPHSHSHNPIHARCAGLPLSACLLVCLPSPCVPAGESGGGLSSRGFFGVRVELTEEGNTRVPEVVEVLFKYIDLLKAPGGINEQVGVFVST